MQSSHNAWLAVLEHFGFLTRKEAEHLANEIKTTIGSENYEDTFNLVKDILAKGDIQAHSLGSDLEDKIKELDAKITTIKVPDLSDVEARIKVLETAKTVPTNKALAQETKTV
jgi:hypothetical protein